MSTGQDVRLVLLSCPVLSCPAGEGFNFRPVLSAPQDEWVGAAGRTGWTPSSCILLWNFSANFSLQLLYNSYCSRRWEIFTHVSRTRYRHMCWHNLCDTWSSVTLWHSVIVCSHMYVTCVTVCQGMYDHSVTDVSVSFLKRSHWLIFYTIIPPTSTRDDHTLKKRFSRNPIKDFRVCHYMKPFIGFRALGNL